MAPRGGVVDSWWGLPMATSIRAFVREEGGATAIEYALIGSMVAVIAIAAMNFFGQSVSQKFSDIASAVSVAGS